jgi:hypothetical protein
MGLARGGGVQEKLKVKRHNGKRKGMLTLASELCYDSKLLCILVCKHRNHTATQPMTLFTFY